MSIAAAVSALFCKDLFCVAMENVLIAAAISVAVDAQRAAELAAEERERSALRADDLECLMAQRMFMTDLQLPQQHAPTTYEVGYTMRHNALVDSHESMRTVHRLLQRGRVSRAMQVAEEELGDFSDAEDAESEQTEHDEYVKDFNVQDVQTALLEAAQQAPQPAAAPVQAYSGRCFRLDA